MCVCAFFRQKIEDLEAERQSLEQQNNVLEMRLERHNLQVGHVPAALFCDGNTRLAHRDHPPPPRAGSRKHSSRTIGPRCDFKNSRF